MLNIETDYDSKSLSCLIGIFNFGVFHSCFNCEAKYSHFCIFNEVMGKTDKLIQLYADKLEKEKEVHE